MSESIGEQNIPLISATLECNPLLNSIAKEQYGSFLSLLY